MDKQKGLFRLTLVVSILVGIIFPIFMSSKPIDWKRFLYIMAMGFTLAWVVYLIILLGYVLLVEGGRNRKELMRWGGRSGDTKNTKTQYNKEG